MTTTMTLTNRWKVCQLIALGATTSPWLLGQVRPTPLPEVFQNVDKLETRMSLDKAEYLPRETAWLTITIRNPTNVGLRVPQPFHEWTGYCTAGLLRQPDPNVVPDPVRDGVPDTIHALTYSARYRNSREIPTVVLAPGQEVSQTFSTKGHAICGPHLVEKEVGERQVRYNYDQRAHAEFKVVRPIEVTAIAVTRLRPEEMVDYETQKSVVRSLAVAFLAVDTEDGGHRLVRADPMIENLSIRWNPRYTPDIFGYIPSFETVGRFDERVLSLGASLNADDSFTVLSETASRRQVELRVPSKPTGAPPMSKQ